MFVMLEVCYEKRSKSTIEKKIMQITLKNINKIKEGTINLNGLTVIAGVNDSGKSTVGKMLFALPKAIYNTKHTTVRLNFTKARVGGHFPDFD